MSMKFNENMRVVAPTETPVLESFSGRPHQEMPRLLSTGRKPLHMKGGIERRLGRIGTDEDAKTLQNNYFTSSNLMVRNSAGDVVVASYENNAFARDVALSLNGNSTISNGSLVQFSGMNSDELYDAVKASGVHVVISAGKAQNLNNNAFAETTLRRRVWREAFAEGDKNLDEEYGALVDKLTGKDFNKNRGLWVPQYEGGRLVWLGSVGDDYSNVDGLNLLDYDRGVLVGVGDGVALTQGANARDNVIVVPTLEQIMAITHDRELSEKEQDSRIAALYRQ